MGNYVRVKKAKVLRFKLISVMYLIFISLSMLQIPIEWLRTNVTLAEYMERSTKVVFDEPVVKDVYDNVTEIESGFRKLVGYDDKETLHKGIDAYNLTDNFFIRLEKGYRLFDKLVILRDYYLGLPDNNPKKKEFRELFSGDLMNGLEAGKANLWVEWKFKHVPIGVVVTWMADLKLKMKLLHGGIITTEEQNRDYLILMAFNIEAVRPGDTVKVVVFNHEEIKVEAKQNNQIFPLNKWAGDTLLFIPQYVGVYDLSFKKNGVEENLKVTSVAKNFEKEKENKYNIFFEGKTSELQYVNLLNIGNLSCDCDKDPIINKQQSKVIFTPERVGWCKFQINNATGGLLLRDSVYVQNLPRPFVNAKGVSGGSIAKTRLRLNNKLSVYASHPDLQNFKYKISNLRYRLVGISNELMVSATETIELPKEGLENLRYVVVESADINNEIKNMEFESPLLIQVK